MPDAFFVTKKTRKRKRNVGKEPSDAASSKFQKTTNGKKGGNPKISSQLRGQTDKGKAKAKSRDEEVDSDVTPEDDMDDIDDLDLRGPDVDPNASGSDEEDALETPAERRLRLAKLYLESIKEGLVGDSGEIDAAAIDNEIISSRLRQDVLEQSGKLHKFIADSLDFSLQPPFLRSRHRHPVTCGVASSSGESLFSTSKDGSVVKWDLLTGKQISYNPKIPSQSKSSKGKGKQKAKVTLDNKGHLDEVWTLAVSDDGKWLVSGGKDRRLLVWDAETMEVVKSFGGHKDSITGLAFRKGSQQLYTGSLDRTLKVFDLSPDVMGYVETLFGHQDGVLGIDALRAETAVSVGRRDKTCRYWKVADETQLVFRGGGASRLREVLEGAEEEMDEMLDGMDEDEGGQVSKKAKDDEKGREKKYIEGSIECIAMVDESTFVSGGDSGSICVWMTQKKKPVFTQATAHGMHDVQSATEGLIQTPRYITALASLRYSDLIASGSWSGDIRLWKLESNAKTSSTGSKQKAFALTLVGALPAPGFVNSLQLLSVPRSMADQFKWAERRLEAKPPNINGEAMTGAERDTDTPNAKGQSRGPISDSVVVVGGLGQEPRLGRWMRLKEGGAANETRVFLLKPHSRTTASTV